MLGLELHRSWGKVSSASEGARWATSSEGGSKNCGDAAVENGQGMRCVLVVLVPFITRPAGQPTSHPTV